MMNRTVLTALVLFAAAQSAASTLTTSSTTAKYTSYTLQKVADGYVFPEGPVWHPEGYLLFSDVHGGKIVKVLPTSGTETWIQFEEPRKTNGLIMSGDGKTIYGAGYGELSLLAIDAKTKAVDVLSSTTPANKPYMNVNDVAVAKTGHVFFTDPKWGEKPGDVQGVYCYDPSTRDVDFVGPLEKQGNGLVLSPDQKTLYVARSGANDVWQYDVLGGKLSNGRLYKKLGNDDSPDGITIDKDGRLYIALASSGELLVLSPKGDEEHRIKIFDRMCTNVEFEKPDAYGVGSSNVVYVTGGGRQEQAIGSVWKVTFAGGSQ